MRSPLREWVLPCTRRQFASFTIVRWAQSERTAQKRSVVELEREPKLEALRARFVERGVWVQPFGNVVYLMPPPRHRRRGPRAPDRRRARRHRRGGSGRRTLARAAYSRSAIATWPHTDKTRNGGGFGGLIPRSRRASRLQATSVSDRSGDGPRQVGAQARTRLCGLRVRFGRDAVSRGIGRASEAGAATSDQLFAYLASIWSERQNQSVRESVAVSRMAER